MRKILMLLVIALTAQVFAAASVSITIQDKGSGWAAINYAVTDTNVVAFALNVSVDSSAKITDIRSYFTGECNSVKKGYGIFPGTIGIDGSGNVTSWGSPIAPNSDPGASGTGKGTGTVVLELGALYDDAANKPGVTGTLCELKVDKCTKMSVAVNGTRAGKTQVGTDGGVVVNDAATGIVALVPTLPSATQINYNCGCACKGDISGTTPGVPDNFIKADDAGYIITLLSKVAPSSKIASSHSLYNKCADMNGDNFIKADDAGAIITCLSKAAPSSKIACSNTNRPTWCP